MTIASDNVFPKVILDEGAAPATPASGQVKVYAKADGLVYSKDDAGAETGPFGAGGSSDLDAIITASSGQDIADALSGAAAPDSGNVFATMADVGGGGGSDLVQTYSGGGSVYIPGMRGSPDRIPASPGADDDEFNALSGWTTLGTLDTSNVTDAPSHWHAKRTNAGVGLDGIYKTAPSMPFTVTAKIAASNVDLVTTNGGVNYNHVGILLTESAPGKLCSIGLVANTGAIACSVYRWTNRTTLASNIDTGLGLGTSVIAPKYLRVLVSSSTSISVSVSRDGLLWLDVGSQQAVTTGLTVANVGLAIGDAAAAGTVEAMFDWIRFT